VSLETAIVQGREAWPHLPIQEPALREFLQRREPFDIDCAADLALACAITLGLRDAPNAFIATYDSHVRAIIARAISNDALREEARQALYAHLLVPADGRPPRIDGYLGHGSLLAFVRVAAVRIALRLVEKEPAQDATAEETWSTTAIAPDTDPELLYLKVLYRAEFGESFRAALASLPKRERTLLRYQIVDGLSIDKVAAIYNIHRATAARHLADARSALVEATHRELAARLRMQPDELGSIMRLIASQIDISVRRLL
jgi:RNA polymerase sigma-70 factor (ECF subfamily)